MVVALGYPGYEYGNGNVIVATGIQSLLRSACEAPPWRSYFAPATILPFTLPINPSTKAKHNIPLFIPRSLSAARYA